MAATGDVERQVAVTPVIAVIEPAFLVAVHGIVRRVEIQHDPRRRRRVGIEIEIDEQPLYRLPVVTNPPVAARCARGSMLQPIERALARKHRAILPFRLQLVRQQGQDGIVTPLVVIVEIFIAEREPTNPLADQGEKLMHHQFRRPAINEAGRNPIKQPDRTVAMMSWTFPFAGLLSFGKAAPLLNQMKRSEEEKTHDGNHDDRN